MSFLLCRIIEKKKGRKSKNQERGFVSKTLKIFIYRYSYTSTLHALWICPLESKYLHLRAAPEKGEPSLFDWLELAGFFFNRKSDDGSSILASKSLYR